MKNNKKNKIFYLAAILIASTCSLHSQTKDALIPPELENTECLGINKEAYHATLMPYANLQEALAANRHALAFQHSLKRNSVHQGSVETLFLK